MVQGRGGKTTSQHFFYFIYKSSNIARLSAAHTHTLTNSLRGPHPHPPRPLCWVMSAEFPVHPILTVPLKVTRWALSDWSRCSVWWKEGRKDGTCRLQVYYAIIAPNTEPPFRKSCSAVRRKGKPQMANYTNDLVIASTWSQIRSFKTLNSKLVVFRVSLVVKLAILSVMV